MNSTTHGYDPAGYPLSPETNALGPKLFAKIEALAHAAAAVFHDEFPGEDLDPAQTDWDSTAWEIDSDTVKAELDAANARFGEEYDCGWLVYSDRLYAEVRRLNV